MCPVCTIRPAPCCALIFRARCGIIFKPVLQAFERRFAYRDIDAGMHGAKQRDTRAGPMVGMTPMRSGVARSSRKLRATSIVASFSVNSFSRCGLTRRPSSDSGCCSCLFEAQDAATVEALNVAAKFPYTRVAPAFDLHA